MKLAILGCGKIAHFHVPAMKSAGFTIIECASSKNSNNIEKFSSAHKIPKFYFDPLDLLTSSHWDALLVCLPTCIVSNYLPLLAHEERPILFEKPVSHDAQLIEIYSKRSNFSVAYNRRFYNYTEYVKKFLSIHPESVIKVSIPETSKLPLDSPKNTILPFYVYDNSVHVLDYIQHLAGTIEWKNVVGNMNDDSTQFLFAHGKTMDGFYINLDMCFDAAQNFSIDIISQDSRISICPLEVMRHYVGMKVVEPTKDNPLRAYTPCQEYFMTENGSSLIKPGLLKQALEFFNHSSGLTSENLASFEDAKNAINAVHSLENLL